MKILFTYLLTLVITNTLLAQTANYQTAIDHFQSNYNADKYEEIFNQFSQEMKKALPLANSKQFLMGLKNQAGNIKSTEFMNYHQGSYAMYKTNFEKAVLSVNISLNDQNLINGFYVKPYEVPKKTEDKTVNSLDTYPKEIADIIFSKSKDLPNHAQLSIALVEDGKTKYYGIIKVNDTIKPAENQQKIFEIGSITKVFTSTVLASLMQEDKLKLTDEINRYYPFAFKDGISISLESLANHTSGLPRLPSNLDLSEQSNPYKNYGRSEIENYLQHLLKFEHQPGTKYLYSNLGVGLLGYSLGLSQKTSFQQLVQQRVFNKYHMTSSFISSQNLGTRLVKGLNKKGEWVSNWDFDVLFAAGGILSTTADLTKFASAQFNPKNKELELTRKTTFDISEDTKIGLGWHKSIGKGDQDLTWHNGGTGGYSSSMVMKVAKRTAVIILSNVADVNDKIDALSFDLINKTSGK